MRTLACLTICIFEGYMFWKLLHKYSKDGDVTEFVCHAPLDEIIRARHHGIMCWLALQMATMMRLT